MAKTSIINLRDPYASNEWVYYHEHLGWKYVRLQPGKKVPISEKGWQNADPDCAHFLPGENIGVQLGERSGGLVDIDLDCAQARELAGLPCFFGHLPAFGRASLPRHALGHRLVICPDAPNKVEKFGFFGAQERDAAKALGFEKSVVLEVRAGKAFTVFPPSVIGDDQLVWEKEFDGRIPTMAWDELERRARLLAFCAFAAKVYAPEGGRNDFCLLLSGVLAHA